MSTYWSDGVLHNTKRIAALEDDGVVSKAVQLIQNSSDNQEQVIAEFFANNSDIPRDHPSLDPLWEAAIEQGLLLLS